jgi:hypothetical protein
MRPNYLAYLAMSVTGAFAQDQDVMAPQPQIQQEDGKVSIHDANTTATDIPITAQIFAGSEGPKRCRGSPMLNIHIPRPVDNGTSTCYDFPTTGGCVTLIANKEDGCEAHLFDQIGCQLFMNLVVFMPEMRAVGSRFRSVSIQCGVTPSQPPAPLNLPGLNRKPKPSSPGRRSAKQT